MQIIKYIILQTSKKFEKIKAQINLERSFRYKNFIRNRNKKYDDIEIFKKLIINL